MPRPTDAGPSPNGAPRVRDADRTRAAILDAALVEFGEHGYAGARTGAIARRAGVNAQLISYYFDGKEGLYKALTQRWRTAGGGPRTDPPRAAGGGRATPRPSSGRGGGELRAGHPHQPVDDAAAGMGGPHRLRDGRRRLAVLRGDGHRRAAPPGTRRDRRRPRPDRRAAHPLQR